MNDIRSNDQFPALASLGREFRRIGSEREQRSIWRRKPWLPGLAAVAAFLALTGPGQAVAERFGELVGIVDGEAVIDRGVLPGEVAPYRVTVSGEPIPGETCVFLIYERAPKGGYGSCLANEALRDVEETGFSPFVYQAPDELLPSGSLVIQGVTSSDVGRIEVSYADRDGSQTLVPTDQTELSSALLRQVGLSDKAFGFFVAFLPPEAARGLDIEQASPVAHLPGVEITAYDHSGDVLARRQLTDLPEFESDLK